MSEINEDIDNFSFTSSSAFPLHRQNSRNNSINEGDMFDIEMDPDEEGSSLTEILSTKNDLKAKHEAMMATKKMYENRIKELNQKINVLNNGSNLSLRILEQKKAFCIKENDRLKQQLNALPSVETLQKQISTLTELLDIPTPSQGSVSATSFLDVLPLQEIGLLSPDESMAILPQRLHSLENKLNSLLDSKVRGNHQSYLFSNGSNHDKEIKKQIQIIEDSSTTSDTKAKLECQNLEKDINDLKEEIRLLKERQEKKQTPPPISDEEIKEIVKSVGGDPKKVHKVRGSLYKYGTNLFSIELRFKQIYAATKEIELPLATYIQTLLKPSKTKQMRHSIL